MPKKTFNIDSTLYPLDFLNQAKKSFEGYDIVVTARWVTIDDDNPVYIFDEFMNYTLSLYLEFHLWA